LKNLKKKDFKTILTKKHELRKTPSRSNSDGFKATETNGNGKRKQDELEIKKKNKKK